MSDMMLPIANSEDDRPKRADALANRCTLLDKAAALFEAHGVEDVTMSQIAREAGVGKGTLYRAFAHKGDLCLALMDEDMRHFQESVFSMLTELRDEPALDKLAQFLHRSIHFFDSHAPLMLEAQSHGMQLSMRTQINQTQLHGWFHQTVVLLVQQAQREQTVSAESDAAYLADVILAPLNPSIFRHQRTVVGMSLDAISSQLVRFVMGGIALK